MGESSELDKIESPLSELVSFCILFRVIVFSAFEHSAGHQIRVVDDLEAVKQVEDRLFIQQLGPSFGSVRQVGLSDDTKAFKLLEHALILRQALDQCPNKFSQTGVRRVALQHRKDRLEVFFILRE